MKNISSGTSPEKHVLARSLNICVTPTKLLVHEIVTQEESGLTRAKVDTDQRDMARASMAAILASSKPPKPNFTCDERQALQNLRKDERIMNLPADKGRGTVVKDKSDLDKKIMTHLRDETTYERLRKNHRAVLCINLRNLREEGVLSKVEYHKVYMSSEIPRVFMASQRYIKMEHRSRQS